MNFSKHQFQCWSDVGVLTGRRLIVNILKDGGSLLESLEQWQHLVLIHCN